jgi:hypothetical protein
VATFREGDAFDWAATAHLEGAHCLYALVVAIERGAPPIPIDRSAWENTMAAVEWAMLERTKGHVEGPERITEDDLGGFRRLHALGSRALDGGGLSPEIHALALRCLPLLVGMPWREALGGLKPEYPPGDEGGEPQEGT